MTKQAKLGGSEGDNLAEQTNHDRRRKTKKGKTRESEEREKNKR